VIVVADTGPLNYLVLIGEAHILCSLYSRVFIPSTVVAELNNARAPMLVRAWIAAPPPWLDIRPDSPADSSLAMLDPGEAAAIALAESMSVADVRIDDHSGRRLAEQRGLRVTGTLGYWPELTWLALPIFRRRWFGFA
jgi:predicted nucleic acid-binding protein